MIRCPTPTDRLQVLFVCTANISRSPYLELRARSLAGDAPVDFASAGVHARDGTLIDPAMAVELAAAAASRPTTSAAVG